MRTRSWIAGVAVLALLGGCQTGDRSDTATSAGASGPGPSAVSTDAQAQKLTITPEKGRKKVRPDAPVLVQVSSGRLTDVTVRSSDGTVVEGTREGDRAWRSEGGLRGSTTYTVKASAVDDGGRTASATSSFTTLTPKRTNRAVVTPGDDWTVGVGMPVVVQFAEPVQRREAVAKAMTVTSEPAVEGAWHWMTDSEAQWRPREYWPAGAKVKVRAALGGAETAAGVWGVRTVTTSFAVGRAQISTVDMKKHTLTLRRDGKVVKKFPITTGKPGFASRAGVKVIMSREPLVRMDAATTGTDPKDPEYYDIKVKWAMRLTYSGEFIHSAPWSVGSQGRANVSHGCTGMSPANAKWMFDHSRIGDVVVFKGGKRALEWGNGYTLWNRPFSQWASQT